MPSEVEYGAKKGNSKTTNWTFKQKFSPKTSQESFSEAERPGSEAERSGEDNGVEIMRDANGNKLHPDRVDLMPKFTQGRFESSFKTGIDDQGNQITGTFEIGIVDKDGNEKAFGKITGTEGAFEFDYKLEEGENIYFKSDTENSTSTHSVTDSHDENSVE
jgi:hypothetical protein